MDTTVLGIWWLWWAVGTFGIVGTALLLWLAPAVLIQIVTWLVRFFIGTRIGNIILAAAVAFFIADVNRSIRDQREWSARTASFQQAEKQRDARIRQETRESVLREVAEQALANAKTDQDVKEFHDALPAVPYVNGTNHFRVGDASCRLRNIAGYAGCGPERSQGMSQAGSEGGGPGPGHWSKFRLPRLITRGSSSPEKGQ